MIIDRHLLTSKPKNYGTISVRSEKQGKRGTPKESSGVCSVYKLIATKETEKEGKIEEKYQLLTFNTWTTDMIIPKDDFVMFHKLVR